MRKEKKKQVEQVAKKKEVVDKPKKKKSPIFNLFKRKNKSKEKNEQKTNSEKMKKKTNSEIIENNKEMGLIKLILEYMKLGYTNEQIRQEFIKKKYPKEFIDYLLQLNTREVKMEKENKTNEEFSDDEVLEELEQGTSTTKDKKDKKVENVDNKQTQDLNQLFDKVAQAVTNLNQRVESVEASLYRLKNF